MCLFRAPSPQPIAMDHPGPLMARNPDITEQSTLPTSKEIVKEDEAKTVQYGSSKKQGGQAQAGKEGAKALRIPLNTGTSTAAAGSGGINV